MGLYATHTRTLIVPPVYGQARHGTAWAEAVAHAQFAGRSAFAAPVFPCACLPLHLLHVPPTFHSFCHHLCASACNPCAATLYHSVYRCTMCCGLIVCGVVCHERIWVCTSVYGLHALHTTVAVAVWLSACHCVRCILVSNLLCFCRAVGIRAQRRQGTFGCTGWTRCCCWCWRFGCHVHEADFCCNGFVFGLEEIESSCTLHAMLVLSCGIALEKLDVDCCGWC